MALIVSPLATVCTRRFGTQAGLFIGVLFETAGLLVSTPSTYGIVKLRMWNFRFLLLLERGMLTPMFTGQGASFASKIWHLFLSQGLAFGFGMGFL
jgi:hypothetical protein